MPEAEAPAQMEETELVYTAPDETAAEAVRAFLEENGIPVWLRPFENPYVAQIPWVWAQRAERGGAWGEIRVPHSHVDEARELVGSFLEAMVARSGKG